MFTWIKGLRKKHVQTHTIRSRSDEGSAEQVELAEFAPAILPFLGITADLQLELYEAATRAVSGAPDLRSKEALADIAGSSLSKHNRITADIRRRGEVPHEVMTPYAGIIEQFLDRIDTTDWHQHVLSLYLVGGLFNDFFASLAGGLKDGFKGDLIAILQEEDGQKDLKALLEEEIAEDAKLSSWLAVWGRRLVGDTLLVARSVLSLSERREFDESEVEPVFTELIADHIRRMDALGLTA